MDARVKFALTNPAPTARMQNRSPSEFSSSSRLMNFCVPESLRTSRSVRALASIRRVILATLIVSPTIVTPVFAYPTAILTPEIVQSEGLSDEWVKVLPTGARASFKMPAKPRYVERSFRPLPDQPPIKVRLHLVTVADGNQTYMFSYHDLHAKPIENKTIKAVLDGAVQGSVNNVLGQLVDRSEMGWKTNPLKISQGSGRQFACRFIRNKTKYIVTGQVFLVDKRLYQLNCIMAEDLYNAYLPAKFFRSFKIIVPEDDSPPRPRVGGSE